MVIPSEIQIPDEFFTSVTFCFRALVMVTLLRRVRNCRFIIIIIIMVE